MTRNLRADQIIALMDELRSVQDRANRDSERIEELEQALNRALGLIDSEVHPTAFTEIWTVLEKGKQPSTARSGGFGDLTELKLLEQKLRGSTEG